MPTSLGHRILGAVHCFKTQPRALGLAALQDIWDLCGCDGGSIRIINGYLPELAGQPASIQLGDMWAEQMVCSILRRVGCGDDIVVTTTRDFHESHLRDNVICIGGPYWNIATRRLMQELRLPLRFDLATPDDQTPLIDSLAKRTYTAGWRDGHLTTDVGFFVRASNPLAASKRIILVAGIETYAVAGLVNAFSSENRWLVDLHKTITRGGNITDDLPNFYSVQKVQVENGGRPVLASREVQLKSVTLDWSRGEDWPLQEDPPDDE